MSSCGSVLFDVDQCCKGGKWGKATFVCVEYCLVDVDPPRAMFALCQKPLFATDGIYYIVYFGTFCYSSVGYRFLWSAFGVVRVG